MMVDQLALPNLANDDGTIKTRSKNHDKSQQDGKSKDIDTILQVFWRQYFWVTWPVFMALSFSTLSPYALQQPNLAKWKNSMVSL